LQRGYIITAVEGQALDEWSDIQSLVREENLGDPIRLEIRRESGALDETTLVKP
jgi:S1-C subfamily serine protease